ncbi:Transferase [Corchorus olitorius]|uniref:Transferase n=1 Tax=Corchorus olitorius TaxID=93759 RepID=A0A1R3JCL1_9ROSI|nr:Transferase [Corchorus olitorius]
MNPQVRYISEWFVKPHCIPEESKQPFYLTTWDLPMLSLHYIQKGLLFAKPKDCGCGGDLMKNLMEKLEKSLSLALVHFYPLAGRFVTTRQENPPVYYVYVDCNNSPGAKLIHAAIDMTISDVVSPTYVPEAVESFFDHDRAINHDGHSRPLLSIQVTELVDGVFIGFSMSHSIVDGTSFWHFIQALSEIFQGDGRVQISRPPVLERWFPEGHGPILNLPFTREDEFITRFEAPRLLERYFHISAESVAKLKTRANSEYKLFGTAKISSFQSLSAFVWKSITKARCLPKDVVTSCKLAINNRSRLEPPLSPNYFGNSVQTVKAVTTVGELLEHNLGWAAWQLHQAVANHTNKSVHHLVHNWLRKHFIYQPDQFFDPQSVVMASSPRFNKYGNEFGLGKPIAVRGGHSHKFDGRICSYPGRDGGRSIDLEDGVIVTPSAWRSEGQRYEKIITISLRLLRPWCEDVKWKRDSAFTWRV